MKGKLEMSCLWCGESITITTTETTLESWREMASEKRIAAVCPSCYELHVQGCPDDVVGALTFAKPVQVPAHVS